ncbi:MAG: hypothetical protein CNCCGFBP_02018 [Fimbriimonadaceae bacterium]|nr:hypothetical protein [Fimbriimonadaceae bacterium]
MTHRDWEVRFEQNGRSGSVTYSDSEGELCFWWELGTGRVVALISVGTSAEWEERFPWAAPRKEEIIQRIVEETIRQQAPNCAGTLDENGWVTIHQGASWPAAPPPPPQLRQPPNRGLPGDPRLSFYRRIRTMSFVVLGIVVMGALGLIAFALLQKHVLQIRTTGGPSGASLRSGTTIVTMMTRLEPYIPSLNRDHANDLFSLGILLHDAESGDSRYIELAEGRSQSALGMCKLAAIEGDFVWVDTPETMRVNLVSGEVIGPDVLQGDPSLVPPKKQRTLADFATDEDATIRYMASGGVVGGSRWLGILTQDQVESECRQGDRAPAAGNYSLSNQPRRIYVWSLSKGPSGPTFRKLDSKGSEGFFGGGLVRSGRDAELLELVGKGWLELHCTKPYRKSSIVAARLGSEGQVVWETDTGIGEVQDILPDPKLPALIGRRPQVPDKVSEPILVVIDAETGKVSTHSLWMHE